MPATPTISRPKAVAAGGRPPPPNARVRTSGPSKPDPVKTLREALGFFERMEGQGAMRLPFSGYREILAKMKAASKP